MAARYQPNLRVSEYLLEERIGAGAFGEVWRGGHHIWTDERVAIKLPVEPEYVRYLQREGVFVHGLRHTNIVRVIGLDPYADPPYLVMELVAGPSLKDVIREHPTGVPISAALAIIRGLLAGLAAAHEAGVLHRDLKPGNVMLHLGQRPLTEVTADDVRIGDFGFGTSHSDAARSIVQSASLARESGLVGTLAYLAPEIRDGQRPVDPRSDLYAVGVILFELLTGSRPAGAELPSTMRADTPPGLDALFQRLYARYERRFDSAKAALAELALLAAPARQIIGRPVHGPYDPLTPFCHHCRRPAGRDDNFCIHCGHQLHTRIRRCNGCGAYPSGADRFCIHCGAALTPLEV